jgi:uncharacterized protein (DUF1499 family)
VLNISTNYVHVIIKKDIDNMKKLRIVALATFSIVNLAACSGNESSQTYLSPNTIPICPTSPNCVSSDAQDSEHYVEPFIYISSNEEAWLATREVASTLPRSKILQETPNYIHIEVRSSFFGFIDDLKLQLRTSDNQITVYSSSRLGESDFGVNRERIEEIRQKLIQRNVIK